MWPSRCDRQTQAGTPRDFPPTAPKAPGPIAWSDSVACPEQVWVLRLTQKLSQGRGDLSSFLTSLWGWNDTEIFVFAFFFFPGSLAGRLGLMKGLQLCLHPCSPPSTSTFRWSVLHSSALKV